MQKELQKNLHSHLFSWNKQYIFKSARSSRKHVSSSLSFSVHLVHYWFQATQAHPSAVHDASGQCGCENAICSRNVTSTLAAVHTRPWLFISAWHMVLTLIDFIKVYHTAETCTLLSYLSAPPPAEHTDIIAWQMWLLSSVKKTWGRYCK